MTMTPEQVREIVRDEVGKMLIESGIVEGLNGLLFDTGLVGSLFADLIPMLSMSEGKKDGE